MLFFPHSCLYFLSPMLLTFAKKLFPPVSSSSNSSAANHSPLHCTRSYRCSLTFSSRIRLLPAHPLPPALFTQTVFVALIANESQNLSALRTCTTYLCVGQRFKDESLSTQRLYMHAFAFENTEPDRHPRQDC